MLGLKTEFTLKIYSKKEKKMSAYDEFASWVHAATKYGTTPGGIKLSIKKVSEGAPAGYLSGSQTFGSGGYDASTRCIPSANGVRFSRTNLREVKSRFTADIVGNVVTESDRPYCVYTESHDYINNRRQLSSTLYIKATDEEIEEATLFHGEKLKRNKKEKGIAGYYKESYGPGDWYSYNVSGEWFPGGSPIMEGEIKVFKSFDWIVFYEGATRFATFCQKECDFDVEDQNIFRARLDSVKKTVGDLSWKYYQELEEKRIKAEAKVKAKAKADFTRRKRTFTFRELLRS